MHISGTSSETFPMYFNVEVDRLKTLTEESFASLCNKYNQEHLSEHYKTLSEAEKTEFLIQVSTIDFKGLANLHKTRLEGKMKLDLSASQIQPYSDPTIRVNDLAIKSHEQDGMRIIAEGKLACLILAGGDASRLGVSMPKGIFDPKIHGIQSIFELITLKIKKIDELCRKSYPALPDLGRDKVILVIMTNPENYSRITTFFKENDYFGYKTMMFFHQNHLPVTNESGQILLRSREKILFAPNGNGAVFQSKNGARVFAKLREIGVEHVQITGVDNILCKWGDPLMVGCAADGKKDIICKYSAKKYPLERVGVFALKDGLPSIIEYSVIGDELAQKTRETGELLYNHSNLLNFLIRLQFLQERILSPEGIKIFFERYNVAVKDVVHFCPEKSQEAVCKGVKFEVFINECMGLCSADRFQLVEVDRDQEFAPIKNSISEKVDNPTTALNLYCKYHQSLLLKRGYKFDGEANHEKGCFIHPSVSYDGERLPSPEEGEHKVYTLPFHLGPFHSSSFCQGSTGADYKTNKPTETV